MLTEESKLVLPDRPGDLADAAVAAWQAAVPIDTYDVEEPDHYPAYLDRRVYQGSSGRVYPLPFFERVSSAKKARAWEAIHLENEFVRLMILPELGGRIHCGLDKTRNYDFFYRNNVIKPALVGVTGPWLSGGVEFNWPQHHRPATYLPTSWAIEDEDDGSRTVWCADLDPFARMKGMHGVRLRPGSSLVELRARLFNRTEDVQTFLWWANVAASVGDQYQAFFPTDVHFVADHAKRAVVSFPEARGSYYGVDYPSRVTPEHPDGDRLDWYRNIPVPTSYMCVGSSDDFFGGYDHAVGAGFVHWADHRISPGKKQWTWGDGPFGWAWDRNLTDGDGPYVELMAGVYTDNQPDFTFLSPGETKTFSQFWYPIQDVGIVHQANLEGAVHLDVSDLQVEVRFVPTRRMTVRLSVSVGGHELWHEVVDCAPGHPHLATIALQQSVDVTSVRFEARVDGEIILTWTPRREPDEIELPPAADEPPAPADIDAVEELYLTGLHLDQYRHATRSPEPYWEEALRRDPQDTRANTGLAARRYRDGRLQEAEELLTRAIGRLTRRNPNPYDGEPHYRLGLVLLAQDRLQEADAAFGKAGWNAAWKVPSELALARLAARRGEWRTVVERALGVLDLDRWQAQAAALAVIGLRRTGRTTEAEELLADFRDRDRLDWWLGDLGGDRVATNAATLIDVALEYAACGLDDDALRVFDEAASLEVRSPVLGSGSHLPLILLHRADLLARAGRETEALLVIERVDGLDRTRCFPGRLADALMLARLRVLAPDSPAVAALHGHWLYSRGRASEAVAAWSIAGDDPVSLRNRGVAAYNHQHDAVEAVRCYEKALALAPADSRLWYERDQLAKQVGESLADRLARIEAHRELVDARDDLCVEYLGLLIGAGRAEEALDVLALRAFQPWEGGEGQTLAAWERANTALARRALAEDRADLALAFAQAAFLPPTTLGEDRHLLANVSHLDLLLGDCLRAVGDEAGARSAWGRAAASQGDFVSMATTEHSERSASAILALERLGRSEEATARATALLSWAEDEGARPARIDYFATSLPTMLLFQEDLQVRQQLTCDVIRAQAYQALGDAEGARTLVAAVLGVDPSEPFALELCSLLDDPTRAR